MPSVVAGEPMANLFQTYSVSKAESPKPLVPKDLVAEIFMKDPLIEKSFPRIGKTTVCVAGEACIGAGPTSSRVAVVDYNGDLDTVFQAVRLHSDRDRFKIGTTNAEDNFYFHQVNVWATIHHTLRLLEAPDVLGRRIPWAFPGGRLKVLPHAGYWENAYYDRSTGALHFFYFEGHSGEKIFTCLSHDIVTHELGHAVLDGLKPYYNEVSSAATAGFHEYFGDAIALTSALSHREMVVELAGRTDSVLTPKNLLANIAQQFGSGLSKDYGSIQNAYLRSAQNKKTMDDLKGVQEEHDFSEVMTGAYYDFLELIYKDLMRKRDRKNPQHRVASLFDASSIVRRMLLRALDYCPPVDLNFHDYARAVYRADKTAYPVDTAGYRDLWLKVMLKRKVVQGIEELNPTRTMFNSHLRNLDISKIASSQTDAYDFVDRNRAILSIPPTANLEVFNLYRTQKISSNDFRVPQEIVIEFVWSSEITLEGKQFFNLEGTRLPLWCGGTLVFNRDGNLLDYSLKSDDQFRRKELARYAAYMIDQGYLSLDDGERGVGSAAKGTNKVIGCVENGRLSLRRNASMRHLDCKHNH
jgi:hypothetical protein